MKTLWTLLAALALALWPATAWARCTTQTLILPDNTVVTCTVCCFPGGSCRTSCY